MLQGFTESFINVLAILWDPQMEDAMSKQVIVSWKVSEEIVKNICKPFYDFSVLISFHIANTDFPKKGNTQH